MHDILVSILILTHNRINLAHRCIPALLSKIGNVKNEVLIWDNCSVDGMYDWLEEYGRADCRITKVFGANKNIGMEAINFLAEESHGKYLIKVDDDLELPDRFGERMVAAYEEVNENKLAFLSWDMKWGEKTFSTRSGMSLYKNNKGKIIRLSSSRDRVLINYDPSSWLVNGACRLSPREVFFSIGGHPKGLIYGIDHTVSCMAASKGYWGGYINSEDLIIHLGIHDTDEFRKFKNIELKRSKGLRDI